MCNDVVFIEYSTVVAVAAAISCSLTLIPHAVPVCVASTTAKVVSTDWGSTVIQAEITSTRSSSTRNTANGTSDGIVVALVRYGFPAKLQQPFGVFTDVGRFRSTTIQVGRIVMVKAVVAATEGGPVITVVGGGKLCCRYWCCHVRSRGCGIDTGCGASK